MRQRAPESFGPYLIHEVIGIGGMASVHRAERPDDAHGTVALKRMLPQFADHEEAVEAFLREAKLARSMHHANVARTFDSGRVGDVYFIAMELISGRNLSQLAQRAAATHPMPLGVALGLALQICEALHYAHTLADPATGEPLGLIHRDVSPSNVIVTDEGIAKLIDFGVAKGMTGGMQTRGLTLKGKFAYMGPEYLLGQIDARADLFALGVILHELLANRPLFAHDDDLETMNRLRELAVPPPSSVNPVVPPALDAVVLRALERDPAARYQTAAELRDALDEVAVALKPRVRTAPAVIAAWVVDAFGETLTLGPTTSAPTPPPRPIPAAPAAKPRPAPAPSNPSDPSDSMDGMTSLELAPETPEPHADDLELAPSPLVVKIAQPAAPLDPDDWTRDTNIGRLVRAGTDLGDPGAQPVSIEEPNKPAAPAPAELAPIVPDRPRPSVPKLPPPVVVIAPRRGPPLALVGGIAAAVLVAAAAAYVLLLR